MMRALFEEKGAMLRVDIMRDKRVQKFIETHADVLSDATSKGIGDREADFAFRQSLENSNYIFSGMKTFHELNEAFPRLTDETGNRKSFRQFVEDVRSIHDTYNKNYLLTEYNFAMASANAARQWVEIERDGDEYLLQYRTMNDDRVRPEHAALEGVTLPPSDSFWDAYYPPNGWNCRCHAVQVRRSKYTATDHEEALRLGQQATAKDTRGIFRFNSGKERKTFPDYNPYTIQRCRDCDLAKGKMKLAQPVDNEVCEACSVLNECRSASFTKDKEFGERLLISNIADKTELDDNKRAAASLLRSFPDMIIRIRPHIIEKYLSNPEYDINNMIADRKAIKSEKGIASGFKKGKAQGCKIIVIDLDESMKRLNENRLATHLLWRKGDFENGLIEQCYVVFNGKSIVIDRNMLNKYDVCNALRKLKQ